MQRETDPAAHASALKAALTRAGVGGDPRPAIVQLWSTYGGYFGFLRVPLYVTICQNAPSTDALKCILKNIVCRCILEQLQRVTNGVKSGTSGILDNFIVIVQ